MLEQFGINLLRKICLIKKSSWPCPVWYPLVLHKVWVSIHHTVFLSPFLSYDLEGGGTV
jgi:hypothetical protein